MYKKIEKPKKAKSRSSRSLKNCVLKKINNKNDINLNNSFKDNNDDSSRYRTFNLNKKKKNKILFSANENNLENNHIEEHKYIKHFGNIDKCPICQAFNKKNPLYPNLNNISLIRNNYLTPQKGVFTFKKKKISKKHFPLKSRNEENGNINLNEFEKAKLDSMKFNYGYHFHNINNNSNQKDVLSNNTYNDKYSAIIKYFNP